MALRQQALNPLSRSVRERATEEAVQPSDRLLPQLRVVDRVSRQHFDSSTQAVAFEESPRTQHTAHNVCSLTIFETLKEVHHAVKLGFGGILCQPIADESKYL